MRRLSKWYVAAFGAPIITLFIVGACSQQPSSTPDVEPVATPTSAPVDGGDELISEQAADQTSRDQSKEEGQTTDTTPTAEPIATPTAEPVATPTAEPVATPTAEPVATPTAEPVATPTAEPVATGDESGNQGEGQTTDTSDSTATQEDIEAIIEGILAELLNDSMMGLRDLEEEVETDISLLKDDGQALMKAGE
jgi:cytoskeletal protein RodZ